MGWDKRLIDGLGSSLQTRPSNGNLQKSLQKGLEFSGLKAKAVPILVFSVFVASVTPLWSRVNVPCHGGLEEQGL